MPPTPTGWLPMQWITLLESPVPLEPPPGRIYSTAPQVALSLELGDVVLKGPATPIVFAEAAAYELADYLNLAVPACGICRLPGEQDPRFCSRKMRGRYPIDHWYSNDLISNPEVVGQTIVFDTWVANWDRNMGNFVEDADEARADGNDVGTRVFAIDFEKSAVLRGDPDRFEIGTWRGGKCWPNEDLGRMCGGVRCPDEFVTSVRAMDKDAIAGILERVRMDMGPANIPWLATAVDILVERSNRIVELVEEAWND